MWLRFPKLHFQYRNVDFIVLNETKRVNSNFLRQLLSIISLLGSILATLTNITSFNGS